MGAISPVTGERGSRGPGSEGEGGPRGRSPPDLVTRCRLGPVRVRNLFPKAGKHVSVSASGKRLGTPAPRHVAGLRRVFRAMLTPRSNGSRHEPARADRDHVGG